MGVIYTAPGGDTVERRTHDECDTAIRDLGVDPADCTIELTPITGQINHWPGIADFPYRVFCEWA